MSRKRTIKIAFVAACIIAAVLVLSEPAMAQCALCKNAVTGSPEAARLSQSLNLGIIILLIPPVLIFCGIFVIAYRHRKTRGGAEPEGASGRDGGRSNWFTKPGSHHKLKDKGKHEAGGAPI
ncbi:MAG: hypothetical protein H0U54_19320 [Acidobacteria bacterium]|jgi:uncharacterized membrane protein|nr:hypothetical protein [Acidobacteriota bacterium]